MTLNLGVNIHHQDCCANSQVTVTVLLTSYFPSSSLSYSCVSERMSQMTREKSETSEQDYCDLKVRCVTQIRPQNPDSCRCVWEIFFFIYTYIFYSVGWNSLLHYVEYTKFNIQWRTFWKSVVFRLYIAFLDFLSLPQYIAFFCSRFCDVYAITRNIAKKLTKIHYIIIIHTEVLSEIEISAFANYRHLPRQDRTQHSSG